MSQHSTDGLTPSRLISNIVAAIAVFIGTAYVIDKAAVALGFSAFAVCWMWPVVNLVLGRTLGLILIFAGLVGWVFSAFRSTSMVLLAIGGLLIGIMPQIFAAYLGASCFP